MNQAVYVGQDPLQTVLGQHNRQLGAISEAHQRLEHILGRKRIELRGRLVKNQDAGPQRKGGCDGDALSLATRKGLQRAVAQRGQIEQAKHLLHARSHLFRWHSLVLQSEGYLILDPIHHELGFGVLEDKADEATEHLRPIGHRVVPSHRHTPAEGAAGEVGHQSVEASQQS